MGTRTEYVNRWIKKYGSTYGRIYKVTNIVTGDLYVGSSKNPLKKRWYQMVTHANAGTKGLLYDNIREWGKECFEIEELYECMEGEDLRHMENKYIDEYQPNLNKSFAKRNDIFYKYY